MEQQGRGQVIKVGVGHAKKFEFKQQEGVCGRKGHTLTAGGPYSTQHSLEDTQDSDVVWSGPWMVH